MKSNNNRTEIVTAFTLILGEFFLHKLILTAAINKENTVAMLGKIPHNINLGNSTIFGDFVWYSDY